MDIHPKLVQCRMEMLLESNVDLPFYGHFLFNVSFKERKDIKTCGVNVTTSGMNFYYNPIFLDSISQKMVNFIVLHEIFHLLWGHPKRTVSGVFDYKLANTSQDMIINHFICASITKYFVEIPKYPDGRNMAIFLPSEYKDKLIFEYLYEWLKDEEEKFLRSKIKMKGESLEDSDTEDNSKHYGNFGKNPKNENGDNIDTFSLEHIFENIDDTKGEYMDDHIPDTVSEDIRNLIVEETIEKLKSRGLCTGNVIKTLSNLRKERKDYITYIKKAISNEIFGGKKIKTISKPNRRGIEGLKGKRKVKFRIAVLLDTSGSMAGTFERTLSYINRNDIEMDIIETDAEVKWIKNLKNSKGLKSLQIKGLGGTILQPGINLIAEKFNGNVLVLTDGLCDRLDVSKIKGNILIISVDKEVPIEKTNNRVKQILISK